MVVNWTRKLFAIGAVGAFVASCGTDAEQSTLSDEGDATLSVGLIDPSLLSGDRDGLEYSVTLTSESCDDLESSGSLPASGIVEIAVDSDCSYKLKSSVGKDGANYWKTRSPYNLTSAHLRVATPKINPKMVRTAAGQEASVSETDTLAISPVQVARRALRGPGASTDLVGHFRGRYMLVDFSQHGCPACTDFAREHGASDEFKQIINDGVCSAAIIVPVLPPWLSQGFDAVITNNSFTTPGNAVAAAADLGVPAPQRVPFVFIVNRAGNRVWPTSGAQSAFNQRDEASEKFMELCD